MKINFTKRNKNKINRKTGLDFRDIKNVRLEISDDFSIAESSNFMSHDLLNKNTKIGAFTNMRSLFSQSSNIEIGNFCSINLNTTIGAGNHHMDAYSTTGSLCNEELFNKKIIQSPFLKEFSAKGTIIGHDVWIGAGAVVMDGVRIGTGAVIGAGAIVTKDVPPYAIVIGTPAKIHRYRFDTKTIERLLKSEWWEYRPADISIYKNKKEPFSDVFEFLDLIEALVSAKLINKTTFKKYSGTDLFKMTRFFGH